MATIGVLSFSDGREFVHQGIAGFVAEAESRLAATCRAAGHQVVVGSGPITSSEAAAAEARRVAAFIALLTHLLDAPPALSCDAGPDVSLTTFDQPEPSRVVVSVFCYRTDARPRLFSMKFTYRFPPTKHCKAVRVAVTGAELPLSAEPDGTATVSADSLDLFDMYLLEY